MKQDYTDHFLTVHFVPSNLDVSRDEVDSRTRDEEWGERRRGGKHREWRKKKFTVSRRDQSLSDLLFEI